MNFEKIKTTAARWNVNERRVRFLAKSGRIKGAILDKHTWLIPKDAPKPDYKEHLIYLEETISTNMKLSNGKYGKFGGTYIPDTFIGSVPKIEDFQNLINSGDIAKFMKQECKQTPLYIPEKFNKLLNGTKLIIKREDLNTSDSLYFNQTYPLALLAKKLNKEKITTATGDANYAKAFIIACQKVGIDCKIYIPYQDYLKQRSAFDILRATGIDYLFICERFGDLYHASNVGYLEQFMSEGKSVFVFPDAYGPHPFPTIIEYCQSKIGFSARKQLKEMGIDRVNAIIGPRFIASNSLGISYGFPKNKTRFVLIESSDTKSLARYGKEGETQGFISKTFINTLGGDYLIGSPCHAINFPTLAPKIADLIDSKQAELASVSDKEAIEACLEFYKLEGIFPCFIDGYSLAYAKKTSKRMKNGTILMCFTGNGEKDKDYILSLLEKQGN